MFEKFLSANVESFKQRYEGTYGFYRDEKHKRLLVRLDSIGSSECVFVNEDGIDFKLRTDSQRDIGFEFLPPKSAYYNTPDGAVWTQRLAQRQFQRGVTGKNLEISLLLASFGFTPQRVDFKTLKAIYENPISAKEAFKDVTKKSVAISPQFALCPDSMIYLFKEQIGSWVKSGDKVVCTLKEPQNWKTEVTDAFTAIGISSEVK